MEETLKKKVSNYIVTLRNTHSSASVLPGILDVVPLQWRT